MPALTTPDPIVEPAVAPLAARPLASNRLIARLERIALGVAALLTLGLHLGNLISAGPLWRDEVGDVVYAAMPSWSHIWSMLRYDNFPPLLLVLLRTWHGLGLADLGGPDFGYRIFGALMGLALAGALWWNARLLGGRGNAPWFSLPLFAAGGFMVRIGDSVRPYAPGWLFMLLSFGLIWRVAQSPRPGRIAAAALVAFLAVQSLYQNAFLLLGIGAAGMLVAARAGRWRAVAAIVGIGVLAAGSVVPYALGPVRDAGAWGVLTRVGLPWGYMGQMLWMAAGSLTVTMSWFWPVAMAAAASAAFFHARRDPAGATDHAADDAPPADARLYAAVAVAVAFPSFLGFLKYLGMMTTPWYYLLPLALTASALDVFAALMVRDVRWRAGRLAFLVVALCATLPAGWKLVQVRVTNADVVAAQISHLAEPGDYVIVSPWPDGVSFHYYYHGPVAWTTLPPLADHSIHRYDLMMQAMTSADPMAPVLARLEETLRAGHRVWIVGQIGVLPAGKELTVLQPAPHDPRAGWNEAAYARNWALQVGGFLHAHGQSATDVRRDVGQRISLLENIDLAFVQGWQP